MFHEQVLLTLFVKIKLSNRFLYQNGSACLMSVDGTDFRIMNPTKFWKGWYSHKFKGPRLRYEVALSIQGGDIVWVNGPFPVGAWPDINIFCGWLKQKLLPGERVEADAGYRGDTSVDLPEKYNYTEYQDMCKFDVKARHKTVNKRLKQFNILNDRFRHCREKHAPVFNSIAVLTQMSLRSGEPLFPIDYRTYNE